MLPTLTDWCPSFPFHFQWFSFLCYFEICGRHLGVGEMLLSEEPPSWLGILAKSSFVSECVEKACVKWKLIVSTIKSRVFFLYLYFWILLWWSASQLDSLYAFEKRIRALTRVWLFSLSLGKNCFIFPLFFFILKI